MNNRARAISILQRARDLLAERLTERVLEAQQDILDDADGLCYLGEIEGLYEQIGGRLAHIGAMLSNLPPIEDAASPEMAAHDTVFTDLSSVYPTKSDCVPPLAGDPLALPPPAEERASVMASGDGFQTFALQIQAGDFDEASRSLAELFEIDATRARRCAEAFFDRMAVQPELFGKAMRLRVELQSGSLQAALVLLWECFGLQGAEALAVLQNLKARLSAASDAHVP